MQKLTETAKAVFLLGVIQSVWYSKIMDQLQTVKVHHSFWHKLLYFVTFVNQAIWSCVGLVIFAGIIAVILIGPQKIFKKAASNALGVPEGFFIPEGKSQREIIESLPKDKQACVKDFFGPEKFEQLLAEKIEPNQQESRDVAQKCLVGQ